MIKHRGDTPQRGIAGVGQGVGRKWATVVVDERAVQLRDWYRGVSGDDRAELVCVSGDASFRRYFRVPGLDGSTIVVDSPPQKEKNAEFVAVTRLLQDLGVRVPALRAVNLEDGFLALEDLGDQLLLPLLDERSAEGYYRQACGLLESLALVDTADIALPAYDLALLGSEMDLFCDWFCGGFLQLDPAEVHAGPYGDYRRALCERALAQPRALVHRDFHARNIMVLDDGTLALIDYQDAVLGPLSYDLVSLLRDCYVRWPDEQVRAWALAHRQCLVERGLAVAEPEAFLTDFDWMGLQRHTKVLGIFARLLLRDGKDGYLGDLPRVLSYVRATLGSYRDDAALGPFARWLEEIVMPRVLQQPWYTPEPES